MDQLKECVTVLNSEFDIDDLSCFSTSEQVIKTVRLGRFFDLYILDIDLPGLNGVDLARIIREYQKHARIIFATSYPEYITHAFALNSSQYFLKPIHKQSIIKCMRKILKSLSDDFIQIPLVHDRAINLFIGDIVYVELYYGKLRVTTIDNLEYDSLQSDLLGRKCWTDLGFLKSHQGYYVNPAHIESIRESNVYCVNGILVPISVRCRSALIQRFSDYLNNIYE